jgi:hypothetical protein
MRIDKNNKLIKLHNRLNTQREIAVLMIVVITGLGVILIYGSHAEGPYVSAVASSGVVALPATTSPDTTADGDNSVIFNSASTGGGTSGNTCTDPVWSGSTASSTKNIDGGAEYYWVDNDAWSGSAGPQSIYVCNQSSWYANSDQTNNGGAVETYPDTEYDVGGRSSQSTKSITAWNSITSTFSENYPSAGIWDAAYDLWTDNWKNETMIWNQWAGAQSYWPGKATIAVTLDGVPYHFLANGSELMFFRDTQVTSGSADILAAYQWEVANGYAKATDIPTQLEYGVEICATVGTETFPMNALTFTLN